MKIKRIIIFGASALCIVTAVIVGIWLARSSANKTPVDDPQRRTASNHADKETSMGGATKESHPQSSEVRAGLEAIFAGLEKAGAKRLSSAQQAIDDALKAKDYRIIAQAVNALVYNSPWPRADVIEALCSLLVNPEPEIKLLGVRYLYLIGDDSGRATLIEIMSTTSPILVHSPAYSSGSYDLRFKAAEIASKYRDKEARSAVLDLYLATRSRTLLHCLINVGVENAGQLIKDALGNQPSDRLMEFYGMAKFVSESSYMTSVQEDDAFDMSTRLAAAWANVQISNDEASAKFIRDFVESQITDLTVDLPLARRAVQYLGTLNDVASIRLLERITRQSNITDLVRVAATNLILNHPSQSNAGNDLVITELTSKPIKLGIDLAVKLAAASSDPRLSQAGRSFDARSVGEQIWKQQGVGRVSWSLWGWADDYVLALPEK